MRQTRSYDKEYKVQAVKLAKLRGTKAAGAELGIPEGTLSGWVHKAKSGYMDLGIGEQRPETALTLAAENEELRRQLKERDKEIKRLVSVVSVYSRAVYSQRCGRRVKHCATSTFCLILL